jgi:hypothetical protein
MTGDDAGGFDAEDAREGHSGCEASAGVQLEVVKSECFDLDQYPTRRRI